MKGVGAIVSVFATACSAASLPHIVHVIIDDFGWANVGYHREAEWKSDVQTPNLDTLAATGLELDRFYVHKFCSPTRTAIQSGRHPIHVNIANVMPEAANPEDPLGGYQGMPLNMTGIGQHMKGAGYKTHFVGKWDVGMATPQHSPLARGYDSWLGYWHHSNDYWTHVTEACTNSSGLEPIRDLWRINATANGPAFDLANGPQCSQSNQHPSGEQCIFEETVFSAEVQDVVQRHDPEMPLFLIWAMHLVHMPLQVPQEYLDKFGFIDNHFRRLQHAMGNFADDHIGQLVDLLHTKGMWNDTLFVVHSDNGGEILGAGICGGNNWPLRGGKFTNFEGGVRVVGLVNGGALPEARRGAREDNLITAWDWYATYCAIAGVDPTDTAAQKAGLPPIDSVNMWPLLSGLNSTGPRTELPLGDSTALAPDGDGHALVGGIIQGHYKLILGAEDSLYRVWQDTLTGPCWPNSSSHLVPTLHTRVCGRSPATGCLFDVFADPSENTNLAVDMPDVFARLLARVDEVQATVYSPTRGTADPAACAEAQTRRDGYWGPWLQIAS